jgi:hypothetical protein
MMEDRFLKRLRKEARKGLRGWPIATIAFYGPNLSQATKVTVGIVPSENADVQELRDWKVNRGDIRRDPGIAREILEFIEKHRVLSVAMTDAIIGCPHQRRYGLRRRMVSGLRVLARTRSLYGGEDQLIFVPIPATLIFPAQKLPCLARLPTRPDGLLSGRRRSWPRPLLDRPSSHDALEILKRGPAAEFSRPNPNRRRPSQLDQLGVSVPAPDRHGGDAKLFLHLRIGDKRVVAGVS